MVLPELPAFVNSDINGWMVSANQLLKDQIHAPRSLVQMGPFVCRVPTLQDVNANTMVTSWSMDLAFKGQLVILAVTKSLKSVF
jgi:hypothetical protein